MPTPDIVLRETIGPGDTGELADSLELHRFHNLGADAIIIPAPVGGVVNATSMINDIIAAAPDQSVLRFRDPGPVRCEFLAPITKSIRLLGASGRYGTRLVPTADGSSPVLDFAVPLPGDLFEVYGPSVERISIDLRATPSATGLRVSASTGWFEANRVAMYGGAVHVDNKGTNARFERMRLIDAGIFFDVDGETGLELTLKDIDCTRAGAGTTTCGIRVLCTTDDIHGDIRIDNVVVNSATGTAHLLKGLLVQSAAVGLSVPVFASMFVTDNCEGPSRHYVNVRDIHEFNGWGNSAAGSTAAVLVEGGGNHRYIGNTWFGGTAGTYEFAGTEPCAGFMSEKNYCPSAPIYRITGDAPTDLFVADFVPGATVDSQITNNLTAFNAARGRTWGAHWWPNRQTFGTYPTMIEPAVKVGTLVNGTVDLPAPDVDGFSTQVIPFVFTPGGTPGHLRLTGRTAGASGSVTITSHKGDGTVQTADTSTVGILRFEV